MSSFFNIFGFGDSNEKPRTFGTGPSGKKLGTNTTEFDVVFSEKSLGLKVSSDHTSRPIVEEVISNTEAESARILPGDVIVAIEGNSVSSFDDFMSTITALDRPITLK